MRRFIILLFIAAITTTLYSQEKRLALVIGNSAYEHGGILKNPVNDAYAMKRSLSQAGFEVIEGFNLSQSNMKRVIDEYGLKLRNYDVGLFFYAGHGIQANERNYLIPVEANLMSEQQVEYDCVLADRVLAHMDAAGTDVNIVILDACRNNPFERSWSRSTSGKGLAMMDAPSGTLIAYATAPGSTASDGTGINGLYTEAILESMDISGITIMQMFQNVRSLVSERSSKQQTPWESTSMVGDFYFKGGGSNVDAGDGASEGVFMDSRDGAQYNWVKIGEQVWMTENMNFYTFSGSWCYENKEENCDIYGRLYQWEVASQVCPQGWHFPSDDEWKALEMHLGMSQEEANKKEWRGEFQVNHSNMVDLVSVFPGYRSIDDQKFYNLADISYFWTSSTIPSGDACFRAIIKNRVGANRNFSNKLHGNSVRCIKN
jgi:uncharacterized protein (TIGR02145 family)